MKKRILGMVLCVCMVLSLLTVAAFADTGGRTYTVTRNFKYGTLLVAVDGNTHQTSPHTNEVRESERLGLGTVIDCAPYKFVGWKETGSGTIYADFTMITVLSDLTFDAVYEVDGSLAITVEGFEVGKTPADTTLSFASTIPGDPVSEDNLYSVYWEKYVSDGTAYSWTEVKKTEVFQADTAYRILISLNNNVLDLPPATTVNGKTPESCEIRDNRGVPYALVIFCEFGTPPEPAPVITIDGLDVVCAQQNYEFTATPPEGVELDDEFGFDTGGKGSGADLTIDENGVGHGVMLTEWYDLDTNYFDLSVYGYTEDEQFVSATKRVQVSPEHIYVDGVCGCGAVQPTLAVTIDGFEVGKTPADIKYSFASTIPGVAFDEEDIECVAWDGFFSDGGYHWGGISSTTAF